MQSECNSILTTWSASKIPLAKNSSFGFYNFKPASSQAYGDNQINVEPSIPLFALWNGNTNKDCILDATDVILVYSDAVDFKEGCLHRN